MDKAKEYINSKTNSILKTNILRNNRDVVATIVYNELTDLLEFSNTSSVTTPIDSEILKRYLHLVKPLLYSGIPMKLKPYCIKCGCGNGYFRGLYDPSRDDVAPSTYTVTVVLNSDSVGKCTVKVVGDVVSIVPSDDGSSYKVVANAEGNVTVEIVPKSGYEVGALIVDNEPKGALSEFTFERLSANHIMYVKMVLSEEVLTEFLVRSDLPDVFYSSTQSALDAVKAAYPSGLTRDVTITCVKTAKESRTGGVWIASLSDWNMGGMHCLTIDGAGLLTYDGKSLGCLQFKFVSNVIIRNTAFWDYANQATATTPDECEAVGFSGDKNRPARNLYIEKCLFSGVSRADNTKLSTMSVNCYNVENIFFNSCKFSGNYGVTVSLNDCSFSSFVKNDINVAFSNKVIAHPVAVTASEGEYLIFEDNKISGDIRENFLSSYNVSQFICRRNKFMDGGGQAMNVSSTFGMKRVVIESNLFVGMNRQPIFEWLKECVSLGGTIEKAEINNNTMFANSTYYELYAFRGGDIGELALHNNILIDATAKKTLNGFVFTTVKNMNSGNNLYRKSGSLLVVTNPSGLATSINIDWSTGRDLAKIQQLGYEQNSAVIGEGEKVLDIQNGGTTYAITEEMDALHGADSGNVPTADIDYKSPDTSTNSIGCYNLHGTAIDETAPAAGYAGDNITDDETFSSDALYACMADSMLVLRHNTKTRDRLVKFSITGTQHRYLILGKYGSVSPYPELDEYGEYVQDELYTINID